MKNKSLVVLLVIMSLLVLGLSGYIVYDKFIDSTNTDNNKYNDSENNNVDDNSLIDFDNYNKDFVEQLYGKKYIANIKGDYFVEFSAPNNYTYTNNGETINGRYDAVNDSIYFEGLDDIFYDDFPHIAYIHPDFIVFSPYTAEWGYTIFYDSEENKDFIKNVVDDFPNSVMKNVSNDCKNAINKVEISDATCSYVIGLSDIMCGITYDVFFNDYDYEFNGGYCTNYFAGAVPEWLGDRMQHRTPYQFFYKDTDGNYKSKY